MFAITPYVHYYLTQLLVLDPEEASNLAPRLTGSPP